MCTCVYKHTHVLINPPNICTHMFLLCHCRCVHMWFLRYLFTLIWWYSALSYMVPLCPQNCVISNMERMLPFTLQTFHLADLQCLLVSIEAESSMASLGTLPDLLVAALVEAYCPCMDVSSFLSSFSQCLTWPGQSTQDTAEALQGPGVWNGRETEQDLY